MIQSTSGVILRTRPLTETSLVVRWLTAECGRLSTVAKGARRPGSPFAGKLDLFYEADLSFVRSRRSDLHTLREAQLGIIHSKLREDLARLTLAAHAVQLIELSTEEDTPVPELYQLLTSLLSHLDRHPARPRLVFAFELKLLRELGLFPGLDRTSLSPAAAALAVDLAHQDWGSIEHLNPTAAPVKQLNAFLHGFLIHHLGRVPKGRGEALRQQP